MADLKQLSLTESPDPWDYARPAKRDYLTPEDVTAAIEGGAEERILLRVVLQAIEARRCEDYRLCAFVALKVSPGSAR